MKIRFNAEAGDKLIMRYRAEEPIVPKVGADPTRRIGRQWGEAEIWRKGSPRFYITLPKTPASAYDPLPDEERQTLDTGGEWFIEADPEALEDARIEIVILSTEDEERILIPIAF